MAETCTLGAELRDYLIGALYDKGTGRQDSRWVMNSDWFSEVRKLTDQTGAALWLPAISVTDPDILLGLPVEIRADGGAPHLEAV